MEGNKQGYAMGLVRKYGDGILDFLAVKAKNESYLNEDELLILLREYEYKVKKLKETL